MAGYITLNRLSLVQLHCEERKQRAHLKKIAEMQHRSGVDNGKPTYFPRLNNSFNSQKKEKSKEIEKENHSKSKKLLEIMQSKATYPPSTQIHPTSSKRHHPTLTSSQDNAEFLERVSKVKGIYDTREWKREYEEHKEHLRISKNNKLFTPREIGVNRQRIASIATANSRRPTFSSSTMNLHHSSDNNA
ncbi:unnamed protein product [Rotaria magnacalcarata]|uniref:Uncharacterized protein n=3 Tax=Rotaria magnacalcarata TaxID=392030 RepID=A0A819SVH9_9BILA|nr:unnamed protein product [Rotaria magnacalcarata]CAF1675067.1 unnamed protein product [Rotaria magnacalcarata]CAF2083957.1 unnamed protein product [Rotaria magnacalcarata]CAF2139751.1 unnamed protein product [Rotaria magnacalcarata]CAF2193460.1 unnamed protein product [Rotaria magnacalcarata]